jgi:hypothetical protein
MRRTGRPLRTIAVERRTSRKHRVLEYLQAHEIARVGGDEWQEILAAVPIPESNLRRILRDLHVSVEQPWAGIRQKTFAELEEDLIAMGAAYRAASDGDARRYCRRVVIAAKDHAKLSSRRPGLEATKREMAQWMLVWLENPEVFPAWVELRKRAMEAAQGGPPATSSRAS